MKPVYTRAQLEGKKLSELKAIALQLSTAPQGDKRITANWVDAILSAQPQPVESAAIKPLVEMSGNDCIADGEIIATITSDDQSLTQPWAVKINNIEVHRADTWARCYDYVRSHFKYGTLPSPQPEIVDDYLFHDDPQPVKLPAVGESYFVGDRLLRCIEIGADYAATWDVIDDGVTVGEIRMDWQCFWHHTLNFELFATPQEAIVDLIKSASELVIENSLKNKAEISKGAVWLPGDDEILLTLQDVKNFSPKDWKRMDHTGVRNVCKTLGIKYQDFILSLEMEMANAVSCHAPSMPKIKKSLQRRVNAA
jgi:hypothetical protein